MTSYSRHRFSFRNNFSQIFILLKLKTIEFFIRVISFPFVAKLTILKKPIAHIPIFVCRNLVKFQV
jgi:hypothetical protein